MSRKPRRQECLKRLVGRCLVCPESRYEALEVHRVLPGAEGGGYHDGNTVVLCGNHHSLVTAGKIVIHGMHRSTFSPWVVHYTDDAGVEHWKPMMRGEG